jgi:hypothetical protein
MCQSVHLILPLCPLQTIPLAVSALHGSFTIIQIMHVLSAFFSLRYARFDTPDNGYSETKVSSRFSTHPSHACLAMHVVFGCHCHCQLCHRLSLSFAMRLFPPPAIPQNQVFQSKTNSEFPAFHPACVAQNDGTNCRPLCRRTSLFFSFGLFFCFCFCFCF